MAKTRNQKKPASSSAKAKKSGDRYLHGYSITEQQRLIRQAKFFESGIYESVDWPRGHTDILEPGCGVGAQTEVLLRRFPQCHVTGLDRSIEQLAGAKRYHAKAIKEKRVNFVHGKGDDLPFADSRFHGAFICFVLEHVDQPVRMLQEVRRTLQAGSPVYCTEVLNSTFFFHPYAPATLRYWFVFNDHQWNLGGDPFCGAKLGNHLMAAGFQNIETRVHSYLLDKRAPKTRNAYLQEFYEMLVSGAPELLKAGLIDEALVSQMHAEWSRAKQDDDAVLYFSFVQARGVAL